VALPRITVLASGRGSNFAALVDAERGGRLGGALAALLTNRPDAGALAIAAAHGIPASVIDHRAYANREAFDAALADAIDEAELPDVAGTVAGDNTIFVAVREGSAAAEVAGSGGLISFLTRYDMRTFVERAMMPAFAFMQVALWPLTLLPLAYGPFMVARRTEYMELGGHRAIGGSDREDVDLARLFAHAGRPVRMLHGADLGSTRHFRSAGQFAAAWRRMYYAYSGHSLAIALAGIAGLATVFLVPAFAFVAAWLTQDRPALLGAAAGLLGLLVLRTAIAISERQPLSTIAWHPITWVATIWAMCLSVSDGLRGRRPVWRGSELAGQAE